MNPPAWLYSKYCGAQQQWAKEIMESTAFQKNSYRTILDLGCGTGEVTSMVSNSFVDVEKVTAVDKSEDMVDFATQHCPNPRIEYIVGDLSDAECYKTCWNGSYELVTSFLALHWVPDQSFVLQNIKKLLCQGGEFLFVISVKVPPGFLKVNELIVQQEKWKDYFQDFSPAWRHRPGWEKHNKWRTPDPAEGYKKLIEAAGLKTIFCEVIDKDYTFPDDDHCKGMLETILPHVNLIPQTERPEFMNDALIIYKKYSDFAEDRCSWPSRFTIIHGQKI